MSVVGVGVGEVTSPRRCGRAVPRHVHALARGGADVADAIAEALDILEGDRLLVLGRRAVDHDDLEVTASEQRLAGEIFETAAEQPLGFVGRHQRRNARAIAWSRRGGSRNRCRDCLRCGTRFGSDELPGGEHAPHRAHRAGWMRQTSLAGEPAGGAGGDEGVAGSERGWRGETRPRHAAQPRRSAGQRICVGHEEAAQHILGERATGGVHHHEIEAHQLGGRKISERSRVAELAQRGRLLRAGERAEHIGLGTEPHALDATRGHHQLRHRDGLHHLARQLVGTHGVTDEFLARVGEERLDQREGERESRFVERDDVVLGHGPRAEAEQPVCHRVRRITSRA